MNYLKKINEKFYSHFDKATGMLFTLKKDARGVYNQGDAWYLKVSYAGAIQTIATFCTKDDQHACYLQDFMGLLWTDIQVLPEADRMVTEMVGGYKEHVHVLCRKTNQAYYSDEEYASAADATEIVAIYWDKADAYSHKADLEAQSEEDEDECDCDPTYYEVQKHEIKMGRFPV